MLIICEISMQHPQKKDIERSEFENGYFSLWIAWKRWEINVVKLKYPLKHYCKQSAVDIKKSVFNKVSTFVRLWKWNDLEKRGEESEWVNVEVDMYLIPLLICVSWRIKKFHLLSIFYSLFRASLPSILPRFLFLSFFSMSDEKYFPLE